MKRAYSMLSILCCGLGLFASAMSRSAHAEPYLAVQQGYQCGACHVNKTGGGLRNDFGIVFAENALAAAPLPADAPVWSGRIGDFARFGGDVRGAWSSVEVPHQDTQQGWDLEQARVYGAIDVIPNRLTLLIDEQLAPGNAVTREAWVRYSDPEHGWYAKGGRFYLPFGWRLQDDSAFVRQVSGINMATPDEGLELGLETPSWSLQLDYTNGAGNAGTGSGNQFTGQAAWVQPRGRIGVAASFTNSDAGDRTMAGLFAGLRTGPVAWLGEVDWIRDQGFPEGTRTLLAGLAEADWTIRKGHNLKLTAEYFDPDNNVNQDQKNRWSLVYEYSPLPFLQLRAGWREYDGIPQNDLDNRRLLFAELHGYF
ncbi:MAG TPA: hypothetical protein VF277_02815 [Steroidobacteraceae bacterium]